MTSENCWTPSAEELRADTPAANLCLDAAGVGLWVWRPEDGTMRCCARSRRICGLPPNERITFEQFLARIHPEDRQRLASNLQRALADARSFSIECRTLEGGRARWIGVEGRRCTLPGSVASPAGTIMDITERKERALQRELMMRDLSHRISNAFAVVSAIVHFTGRTSTTAQDLTRDLQARIGALARAYSVPSADENIAMRALVERELAPFETLARITLIGEPTWLTPRFAIPMTLILHELATNALKYGALRGGDGELFVRWWSRANRPGRCTVLHWKEHSNEPIAPPARTGVGSTLLSAIARHVEGTLWMEFQPDGLAATVIFPCERCATQNLKARSTSAMDARTICPTCSDHR